jgi:hypothetical protein
MSVSEKDRNPNSASPKGSRAERLGEQLRANLKRRKAGRSPDMAPESIKREKITGQDGS